MITTPDHRADDDRLGVRARSTDGPHRDLALLPLRVFLGITYGYAGLQKLASTTYLDPHAPSGVATQMRAAVQTSPISGLLGSATHHAIAVGLLIAFGELAVGIGTLLGLWTRVAAVGGMALALSFLLAVSWHSSPYYLGSDVIVLAAFTPFALAPPSRWSIDAFVARRVHGSRTRSTAALPDEPRRRFLETLTVAGWVGLAGLGMGGTAAALGRLLGDGTHGSASGPLKLKPPTSSRPAGPTTTGPTTTGPSPTAAGTGPTVPPGTAIGRAADVPVGGSAQFANPATGAASIVVQPRAGVYEGCSAICTHEGCTVEYRNNVLHCPCHGAEFDPATGAVLQGPAREPLTTLTIRSNSDGSLYLIA